MGSIVGDELSGQDVISGLPKKPGETEQLNSNRFALTQGLATTLVDLFKNYAPTYQEFVAAKSYNSNMPLKKMRMVVFL